MKYLLNILPILLLMACNASKKAQDTKPVTADSATLQSAVIKMSTGPCFGRCPVYDLTIEGSGNATLVAKKFMDYEGTFQRELDSEVVVDLVNAFLDANFWGFEDKYTGNITDLPTTWLTFSYEGQTKEVEAYYNVPEELTALIGKVHAIATDKAWAPDK